MKNIKQGKISDLTPDTLNANKHTQYGMHLMEKSISELGLGRSIIVDKNGKIIGGNATVETAANLGLENVIIIETTGDQLVAVKRMDIDLDSERGRSLALADNATSKVNLDWDADAIQQISEQWDIKPEDWGIKADFGENNPEEEWEGMPDYSGEDKMGEKQIIVHFKTMQDFEHFCMLINQVVSEKAKYIWFPEEKAGSQTDHAYEKED